MCNIQSHTNTVMEFPKTGIVRFLGDNSNGKSVMVKALQDVVSNNISRPAARRSIIRRGNTFGELLLENWDGDTLFVHIDLEASRTYAELTKAGAERPVRRYLADKAIPVLVREFGWHFDDNCGISINIHNDTDGLLFVDTKKSINFDLLNGMRSDTFAEAAIVEIERLLKESKGVRTEMQHIFEVASATYCALQYYDKEEEARIRDDCLYYAELLENLTMPAVPKFDLKRTPTFYGNITPPPHINIPKIYQPLSAAPRIQGTLLHDMAKINEGVCPTCGKPLIGGHEHEMV